MKRKVILTETCGLEKLHYNQVVESSENDLFSASNTYFDALLVIEDKTSHNSLSIDLGLYKDVRLLNRLYRVVSASNIVDGNLQFSFKISKVVFDANDSLLKDFVF